MKDPMLCGIGWLNTGRNDPMWPACKIHDLDYCEHIEGKTNHTSSAKTDRKFLRNMLRLLIKQKNPRKKLLMTMQIPMYYGLVRTVGAIRWNKLKQMPQAQAEQVAKKPPSEIQKEIERVRKEIVGAMKRQ